MAQQRDVHDVTVVVCAGLDDATDALVRRRVAELHGCGLPLSSPPRHRAHLTLAATRVPAQQVDGVLAVVGGCAAAAAPFRLRFGHLGVFPGGVLWLAPEPSPHLAALQRGVDAALAAAGHGRAFGARCDPQQWVAHATLARGLGPADLGRATALTARGFRSVDAGVGALLTVFLGGRGRADVLTPFAG